MSLRVLFVSRRFPPDVIGGGEVSALLLARALRARGVEVEVCTFTPRAAESGSGTVDGVPVHRQHLRTFVPPASLGRLAARIADREPVYLEMAKLARPIVERFRPDRLHALNLESIPAVAWLSFRSERPFVATINSPWMLCYTGDGVDARGQTCIDCRVTKRAECITHRSGSALTDRLELVYSRLWFELFQKSALRAETLIAISDGLRADLVRLGYPADRLITVRNPIEPSAPVDGSAIRQRLGIPEGAFLAGYLGRRSPAKGLDLLISAVARHPGMHLLVVGKDDGSGDAPERQARALGLAERVHFVGYQPSEQLAPYYAACQAVVMAGPFYEALGRMLMEAAAQRVALVARAQGGIPDVIRDALTGLLLQATDPAAVVDELAAKLGLLDRDRPLAARLGNAAREHVGSAFTPERAASRLRAVYLGEPLPAIVAARRSWSDGGRALPSGAW